MLYMSYVFSQCSFCRQTREALKKETKKVDRGVTFVGLFLIQASLSVNCRVEFPGRSLSFPVIRVDAQEGHHPLPDVRYGKG